jgi:hypothetical protein
MTEVNGKIGILKNIFYTHGWVLFVPTLLTLGFLWMHFMTELTSNTFKYPIPYVMNPISLGITLVTLTILLLFFTFGRSAKEKL